MQRGSTWRSLEKGLPWWHRKKQVLHELHVTFLCSRNWFIGDKETLHDFDAHKMSPSKGASCWLWTLKREIWVFHFLHWREAASLGMATSSCNWFKNDQASSGVWGCCNALQPRAWVIHLSFVIPSICVEHVWPLENALRRFCASLHDSYHKSRFTNKANGSSAPVSLGTYQWTGCECISW